MTSLASWNELLVGDELAHLATEPAREARTAPLPDSLQPALREALAGRGIEELYAHQAEAYAAAKAGGNVIVTTGTASGKTLAFNLPVLDALAADRHARALYLYPTKALAQDQARSLGELGLPGVRAAIYDGDTPTERRRQIRGWANLVLTNPDMVHIGVLPRHDLWGDFLHNLRFVVVDEAHVYRGVFGSHVANVLRRLRRLVEGDLLGVTSTDALELGIDIGDLDCAISVGFPGTVASLRQQWGRAGRREHGLAILIASEDALDQYFMREPPALLERHVEAAILDHANPRVLDGHVAAAAFEAPIDETDTATLGPEALERAPHVPELRHTARGWVWAGKDSPAARIPLRSTTPDSFLVVDASSGDILGLAEQERAYSTVHEGAVYLHLGRQYLVRELDLQARRALVEPFDGDWYTQAKKETETSIEEALRVERRLGLELSFGRVSVTEQVIAYQKKAAADGSTLDTVPLNLPPTTFDTEAVWFMPRPHQLEGLEAMPLLLSSLHAAEHSLIALLPLWAMCDRWDIGGLSTNLHLDTGAPTVFVYDGHAGGVGIAARGFDQFEGWVADTAELLAGCPCERGCPSCVQSPKCGNLNEFLDKAGALTLLRRMLAT